MEKSLRLFLNSRLVKSMPDTLTIQTSGEVVMGTKQAKYFALSICSGIKNYLKTHRTEYEAWLQEQKAVNK